MEGQSLVNKNDIVRLEYAAFEWLKQKKQMDQAKQFNREHASELRKKHKHEKWVKTGKW